MTLTPPEIKSLYLAEANGDVETAFQNLCRDAAEIMSSPGLIESSGHNRNVNFSVMAPKPRPKAVDE